VRFDDVIEALKRVDGEIAVQPRYAKLMSRGRRWKDLYGGGRDGRFAFDEACHVRKEMDQAQKSARTRKASARTRCTRSKPTSPARRGRDRCRPNEAAGRRWRPCSAVNGGHDVWTIAVCVRGLAFVDGRGFRALSLRG